MHIATTCHWILNALIEAVFRFGMTLKYCTESNDSGSNLGGLGVFGKHILYGVRPFGYSNVLGGDHLDSSLIRTLCQAVKEGG